MAPKDLAALGAGMDGGVIMTVEVAEGQQMLVGEETSGMSRAASVAQAISTKLKTSKTTISSKSVAGLDKSRNGHAPVASSARAPESEYVSRNLKTLPKGAPDSRSAVPRFGVSSLMWSNDGVYLAARCERLATIYCALLLQCESSESAIITRY